MTDYPHDKGIPGLKMGRSSVSNGDTVNTRLGTCKGFVAIPTTAGGSVGFTSVSGGTVTISLYNAAGVAVSADENVYWIAWGED